MNLILYLNLLIPTHNKIYMIQCISNIKGPDNFPTQMFYNNQQACNDQEKAQLFNNYFYSCTQYCPLAPLLQSVSLQCLQVLAHYMTLKSMSLKYSLPYGRLVLRLEIFEIFADFVSSMKFKPRKLSHISIERNH